MNVRLLFFLAALGTAVTARAAWPDLLNGEVPAGGSLRSLLRDGRSTALASDTIRAVHPQSLRGPIVTLPAAGPAREAPRFLRTPGNTPADVVWIDEDVPPDSTLTTSGGDDWIWVTTNPAPFSGFWSVQTVVAPGLHELTCRWPTPMTVAAGDALFVYVHLDPGNPPQEIMLSWQAGDWEHRAFWGENLITYGENGSAGRFYAGPLPEAGGWVRLEVPASAVGLAGAEVQAITLSTFGGRVTYDRIGRGVPAGASHSIPPPAVAENAFLKLPVVGDHQLRVLAPTVLELQRITTKDPDPALPADWNFVDANGTYTTPATSRFNVTINGQATAVTAVGFRRRVAYAPVSVRDLRIDNSLYLTLASPVPDNATVVVTNPDTSLWPASMAFSVSAHPLRLSPAVHVNQEGYAPSLPKQAMVGLWLGNLGELDVNAANGFKLISAATGATVYSGTLTAHRESGFTYAPMPYQKVYAADFSAFTSPGEYQLVVPGLGASLPFVIDDGIPMLFTRTYAAGLFHQRCGAELALPFSRFTHAACHTAAAEVPSPQSSYAFTWTTIASKNADAKTDPRHTAPQLKDEASQLYPFVNQGKVDVSGGHHDAGDYSKYTINVAQLTHLLTFTADAVAGAGALDNLGLPESGDGRSDILQEAKREADYLAKLQDADGGFYFIVYPKTREYEGNVAPDQGDSQVVWPKNTSATAAGVAALAQMASSPAFKAAYPTEAAAYLAKAKLGWQFLANAIAKYGKDGSYQKVTFYGNNYLHDDEIAWAACELFLATGDQAYHAKLKEWFPNPADPATFRWGWWRMSESWGNAIRSYAFAARTGRLPAAQLDSAYLAACEQQIKLAGDDALAWSNSCAYGSAFPEATRRVLAAGWYFSLDQASDMAVAYQLNPKPEYLAALTGNLNYEAGTNPVNAVYLTGVGLRRQHEIVHQWANNNRQTLPIHGIPIGNIQAGFDWLTLYSASGNELSKLSFPSDANGSTNMYPFYDRWADSWNVTTEFITVNQARSLLSCVTLAAQTSARTSAWKPSATATIVVPALVPVGSPTTLTLTTTGLDLTGARILWDARDQEPDFGPTYVITPENNGPHWAEAEILWPDGRRVFATAAFQADSPVVTWVDDALPAGAWGFGYGGEAWTWISTSPTPKVGRRAHMSKLGPGRHEHGFDHARATLTLPPGSMLFCWVYLDPANVPEEIMLHWNDGFSWEHRAFWGEDRILDGISGTTSRQYLGPLPAAGGWVKLEVPAAAVGLEGATLRGMCFSSHGGLVWWDAAGKVSR